MKPVVRRRRAIRATRDRNRIHSVPVPKVASRARGRTGPRRGRRGALVVASLLAAALALAWWLARPERREAPALEPERPPATSSPRAVRRIAKKIARPAAPAPATVDEARLRAALQERAPDLRACSVPPGAPAQVPARLRVAANGKTRGVELTSPEPIPAPLAACLRDRISAWSFDELRLHSDVAVLVTFALR